MRRLRILAAAAAAGIVAAGLAVFALGELYDLSAVRQHPLWLYRVIGSGRDAIVSIDAASVERPAGYEAQADPANVALFEKHCAQCHGAPGRPPAEFALGMMPVPANLVASARERSAEEVFWFVKYGLKMSGMPAWDMRMSEADMWRITALVESFPALSPLDYARLREAGPDAADALTPVAAERVAVQGDPERGRRAMQLHACRSCHLIPGIVGRPNLRVGPDLAEAGSRRYIAGVLQNTPGNMIRWIVDPKEVDPLTAMPDLGVSEGLARDMAAYLYSIATEPRARTQAPPADEG